MDEFDLDRPDFEEMFRLITVDRKRKKKIRVTLIDEDGDEVPIKSVSKQLMEYVTDQFKISKDLDPDDDDDVDTKASKIVNQILPLVSQSMVAALPGLMGQRHAYLTLAMENTRHSTIMMMMLAICLYKFIKQKGLKIVTEEEDVTQEELDKMMKISKMTSSATTGALLGMSPQEIIKDLMDAGEITADEIKQITGKDSAGFDVDPDDEEDT